MKKKLLAFAAALFSLAVLGVVQLQTNAAQDGQVGNAPRCDVVVDGPRSAAFKIHGKRATVKFAVKGKKNCKVQLTTVSFYAPSINGKPYDKQVRYDKVTKTFTRGNYTMGVNLPPQGKKPKLCYYQVDLTYGPRLNPPMIAYGHGELDCAPKPKPAAACDAMTVSKLSDTRFRFSTTASTKNGATVKGYRYVVTKGGEEVLNRTFKSTAKRHSLTYNQTEPGTYKVRAYVKTSVGEKTAADCTGNFTVKKPPVTPEPGVEVDKKVDGVDHKEVGVNTEFTYQIRVTNTGETDLKNVKVTDTPEAGVTLLVASHGTVSNNTWNYTIPMLAKGEHMDFTITAKVPTYKAGTIKNTVCVDAPEVPGNPDDCDDATVEVPPEPKPGVEIDKKVDNVEHKRVGVNVEFTYQIAVKNTGETDLKNVKVTDTPEAGITLLTASEGSVADNTWTHTIPMLAKGETKNFTITAKVPEFKAGDLKNTVCVDAPEVPGNPDDCDDATVEVPPTPEPGEVTVCDPESGDIITVPEDEADNYLPVDSPECEPEVPPTPETPTTPTPEPEAPVATELPTTGPAETALKLLGVASLAGAGAYYLASRRG